ncbi:Subtilisin-like protease [Triticum urartu]|uniref:Subtilisin-like protease n=1 Tax=Triticum urartu TaxID=4572 RepID=M7YP15_TRIUA|nr:Subtilisin-like protease [Triticum urartu]
MDVSAMPTPFTTHEGWYTSVLSSLAGKEEEAAPEHLYTYAHAMHGFSAVLTPRQLAEIQGMEGHVTAFAETYARLHTTRTPEFLGLTGGGAGGVWPASKYGEDVIVGIVDTGVWPESESFSDAGMTTKAVPARWKGACEKGIFVTCSAGNDGSDGYTIMNGAPWITTVGASTIDREFTATVTLGSGSGGKSIHGKSVYPEHTPIADADLYYGHGNKSKQKCDYSSLSRKEVSGKYVFCTAGESLREQMDEVQGAGGRGLIAASNMKEFLQPTDYVMPLVLVTPSDGAAIQKFVTATKAPKVSIRFVGTELGVKPAPAVAYFSSRGPTQMSPAILKPDIVAPGVDILAAWVPNKEIMEIGKQKLYAKYMLVSGTSMASPHVAGVVALLRSAHPDWSPAAIRSAMMTTAYVKDNANNVIVSMPNRSPGTPLDYGSGHVSPNQATDPGLVYDATADDYVNFLCGLRYSSRQIAAVTGRRNASCAAGANLNLNYPSFMVILNHTTSATRTFKRVLTNVAGSAAKYSVSVTAPAGMKVTVTPSALSFGGKGSKQGFSVTVQRACPPLARPTVAQSMKKKAAKGPRKPRSECTPEELAKMDAESAKRRNQRAAVKGKTAAAKFAAERDAVEAARHKAEVDEKEVIINKGHTLLMLGLCRPAGFSGKKTAALAGGGDGEALKRPRGKTNSKVDDIRDASSMALHETLHAMMSQKDVRDEKKRQSKDEQMKQYLELQRKKLEMKEAAKKRKIDMEEASRQRQLDIEAANVTARQRQLDIEATNAATKANEWPLRS